MKKFCLICVLIAGAMNAATSQTTAQKVNELTERVAALEKYVYANVQPKISSEPLKKCKTKVTVFAFFGPMVRDVKLCAPLGNKTATVKIKPFLFRGCRYVLITPATVNGVTKAFKIKVGKKYDQETFTRPVLVSKKGRKIIIQ